MRTYVLEADREENTDDPASTTAECCHAVPCVPAARLQPGQQTGQSPWQRRHVSVPGCKRGSRIKNVGVWDPSVESCSTGRLRLRFPLMSTFKGSEAPWFTHLTTSTINKKDCCRVAQSIFIR
ncbi:uncharacterized protein V6R79_012524 [Siganus canaliculatus]